MSNISEILQYTKELFPSSNYTAKVDKDDGYILVNDYKNRMCVKFIIFNQEMDISDIAKCNQMSGTSSLTRLLDIAKRFHVTYIQLVDASSIITMGYDFPLHLMQILTTGNSWYNKHGFISEEYKEELENNFQLLHITVGEFIKKYFEEIKKNQPLGDFVPSYMKQISMEELDSIPEFLGNRVKDVVNEIIEKHMKKKEKDPVLRWFKSFLTIAEKLVKYNSDLHFDPNTQEEIEHNLSIKGGKIKRKKNTTIQRKYKKKN